MAKESRRGRPRRYQVSTLSPQIAGADELARLAVSDALLTVEQAAEFLQVSRGLVYVMIRSGEIPCITFHRVRRIPARDLDDFIKRSWVNQSQAAGRRQPERRASGPVEGRLAKLRKENERP